MFLRKRDSYSASFYTLCGCIIVFKWFVHIKILSLSTSDPPTVPSDTCYVLSFAIIMLNTSLHNPNVRDKPPVERFISMNRGINEGGDLPEELLRVEYFSVMSVCVCACVCDEWSLGPFCHTCSIRKRHFLHCLPVWLIVFLLPPPAEPLRQHQKRAFQNPRGRWQWSDAHVLQPWQRRLAPKARYVHSGDTHTQKEETLIMLIFVRRHSTSDWGAVSFISLFVCVCLLVYDGLSAAMLEVDSSWGIKWLKIADCTT